jgi:PAS domain S-box-containing protein
LGAEGPIEAEDAAVLRADLRESLEELRAAADALREQQRQLIDAQSELQDERQNYRELFDLAPDAYIVTDERGVIWQANGAATKLLQLSGELLAGSGLVRFMASERRAEFQKVLRRAVAEGSIDTLDLDLELRPGELTPVEARVVAGAKPGSPGGATLRWLLRDVRRSREMEKRVLEISDEERGRIGAELHDKMSALVGVTLGLSTLEAAVTPELTDRVHRLRQVLTESVQELRNMSHGFWGVDVMAADLHGMLTRMLDRTAMSQQVVCHLRCPEQVAMPDDHSAAHLLRIAQEAVANAIKHGHATRIDITVQQTASHLLMTVTDNGSGIPEAKRASVAAGLGLKLMTYRAQLLRGRLRIASHGKGCEVTCDVPIGTDGSTVA